MWITASFAAVVLAARCSQKSYIGLGASLFFQSELVVFKLAEQFVKAKGRTDHSVAELFYIDDDKGTGYADGFASHYQAELITETTNAMETFDKSHIGTLGSNMFSTYFQPDRVDGC